LKNHFALIWNWKKELIQSTERIIYLMKKDEFNLKIFMRLLFLCFDFLLVTGCAFLIILRQTGFGTEIWSRSVSGGLSWDLLRK
jgi:hypothetical protein